VTDNVGESSSATSTLVVAVASSGGGGGGALDWPWLALLGLLLLAARRKG
jgi:MYXO-CTERM domain-containing protein